MPVETPTYRHRRVDRKVVRCRGILGRHFEETGEPIDIHVDHAGHVVAFTFRGEVFEATRRRY